MIADASASTKDFSKMSSDLAKIGEGMGLEIRCQKSEIFEMMHRI
jgi:ACT domain-containing protein